MNTALTATSPPKIMTNTESRLHFTRKLDRFSHLQLLSGMDALADADIKIDKDNEYKTGIVIGTADGPMTEILISRKRQSQEVPKRAVLFRSRIRFTMPQAVI